MSEVKIKFSKHFEAGFPQSVDTSMRNLAGLSLVESKKIAPFDTGALVKSGRVEKVSDAVYDVKFGNNSVPYAGVRNFVNFKNPHTRHYVENGVSNVLNGSPSQWWKSVDIKI